jgi:predicted nucleotidyltransferase
MRTFMGPQPDPVASLQLQGHTGVIIMPNMSMQMPKKGSRRTTPRKRSSRGPGRSETRPVGIADALFPSTRQRVLGLLFGQSDRRFTVSELISLARAGSGAVQREAQRLASCGLVTLVPIAGRKYYQANQDAPVYQELRGLIDKTIGVPAQLSAALSHASERIQFAFLYGSLAKGTDAAASDVDVIIVSDDLGLEGVYQLLEPVERMLGRKVSPTLYNCAEFLQRRRRLQPFLTKVLAGKHVILLGSEADIEGTG